MRCRSAFSYPLVFPRLDCSHRQPELRGFDAFEARRARNALAFGEAASLVNHHNPVGRIVREEFQVSVPAEAVKDAEDKAARRYASTVRLPGFRPGKAPATVVRKKFGEAIRQEALESLVREAYQEFVEKESIKVAAQPHVHDLKFEEGKPLTFELHLEVRPTIELARTNGFRVQRQTPTVTDEHVAEQLEQVRDEKATWTPVSEKPQPGDMVNVQLATATQGEDAAEGKSYPLVLGAGQAAPRREAVAPQPGRPDRAEVPARQAPDSGHNPATHVPQTRGHRGGPT